MTDLDVALIESICERFADIVEPIKGQEPGPKELHEIRRIKYKLRRMGAGTIRQARMLVLRHRDGDECHWCHRVVEFGLTGHQPLTPIDGDLNRWCATEDHVIPRSEGGRSRLANLVISCQPCNSQRAGHTAPYLNREMAS